MKRRIIILALLLSLVFMGTALANGPPSSASFDMGNDIWLTLISVELYKSPRLEQNGLIFDVEATYYVTDGVDIQLEHSSAILTEAQIAVANAESNARAKLRKACELIMETAPTFSAEMLGLRKRLAQMAATVNSWITP